MARFVGSVARYPARALSAWYLGLIVTGSLLLAQPVSWADRSDPIAPLDAVFTATSATCVTGLIVRSTPHDFSTFGQVVLLVLMQLGGIGIMTFATLAAVSFSGRESLRHRVALGETLGASSADDLRRLLWQVIALTLFFEAVGFVVLFTRFQFEPDLSWSAAAWHALFHTVSAFCNAGFALRDDSLVHYQADPVVNLTVMMLVVVGGIGFPVLRDLQQNWGRAGGMWEHLHLHTKLVLIGTAALITLGTVAILVLEWNNALRDQPLGTSLLVALFQSITTRTAGFNTIDLPALSYATLFIMMLLMFVGAAPGSTGGGFKVSTFMVLALHAWTKLRGFGQVRAFRRNISGEVVGRAIATVLMFAFTGTVGLCLLLITEDVRHAPDAGELSFFDVLFEIVSALGTVGVSTGATPLLSDLGRCVIIALMFAGRIGPVSLVATFAARPRDERLKYPDEVVLIG